MKTIRFGVIFCAGAAFVSACSGGNNPSPPGPVAVASATPSPTIAPSASPTAISTATPTVAPSATPTAASSLSPAVEHMAAQEDLSALRPILIEARLEQGLQTASIARRSAFARARRDTSGSCSNGVEFSSTTSGATTTFALDFFYDAACTEPWQAIAGKEIASASSGTARESVTATDTVDGKNGLEVEYDAISGTIAESSSSDAFAFTASTGPTSSQTTGDLGADCTIAPSANGVSETCSFGGLAAVPAFMGYTGFGTVLDQASTLTENANGYVSNGSGSGTFYEGSAPPVMQLANTGTAVSITGATAQKTLTETEKITATAGATLAATLTITDASDNAIVIVNVSGYTIAGTIENATTKAVEATFTLDINGNGTITYSNGTTGTITAFGVVS